MKNLQKQVIGNKVVVERLKAMNTFIMAETGLKSSEFVIPISGGDRYSGENGEHREIATDILIPGSKTSSAGSDHLNENYGGAVDISTDPEKVGNSKVTKEIMRAAAEKAGLYPSGQYASGHIHGEIPNKYRTAENYTEGNVPFVEADKPKEIEIPEP